MSDRKRIEDLEKRVKELEALPIYYPTIIMIPATVPQPPWQPHPWQPWSPFCEPWITYNDGHAVTS